MSFLSLVFVAVGLSMDAFAVAVTLGLSMRIINLKKMLIVGAYFGVFQGGMPIIGYFLAAQFADKITAVDHWIAFVLLGFIGGKMIVDGLRQEGCKDRECPEGVCADRVCPGGERPTLKEPTLAPSEMLPLAIATSIDALAVGVSFAFLQVNIVSAASLIALTTLIFSMAGTKIGRAFGTRFKSKATLAGGVILVGMGLKILIEHIG